METTTLNDPYYCPHCGKWIERERRHAHLVEECDQHLSNPKKDTKESDEKYREEHLARSRSGQTWFNC